MTFSKIFQLKIDHFSADLLGCRAFFKAQGKTSKIFEDAGKFYKIFHDAGKFYKIFPCMITDFSRFLKSFPACIHATCKKFMQARLGCRSFCRCKLSVYANSLGETFHHVGYSEKLRPEGENVFVSYNGQWK